MTYAFPPGGLPGQNEHPESTAVFTEAYAVIPSSVQRDIVTSFLPGWVSTRAWILARPMSGFAETFAQYALELAPEGGSGDPVAMPDALVTHETRVPPVSMPDCNGMWATQRFFDPLDLRYDCHVNIVNFQPGGRIPFAETHVMEHGLYVLEGTAEYLLNRDWVTVGPGDFMWLRAFCPQACIATGNGPFRYLLYKDVNRHVPL